MLHLCRRCTIFLPARVVGLALGSCALLAARADAGAASAPTTAPQPPSTAAVTIEPVPKRTVELTTVVTIPPRREPARVWVPVPLASAVQQITELAVQAPTAWTIEREPVHGNRFLYSEVPPAKRPITIRWTAVVKRSEWWHPEPEATDAAQLALYRQPLSLVPVGGPVLGPRARMLVADAGPSTEARGRRMFDYVRGEMRYDKSGEGWGRGDAVYACDVGKGNCTDFHAMFNGLARTAGIPARFTMGLSFPAASGGEIAGYHCWTAYWIEGKGWVPLDISESVKHPDRPVTDYYGRLAPDRIAISRGRDVTLAPPQAGPPLNFVWDPYVEIGGRPAPIAQTRRSYRNLTNADLIFRTAVR